MKMVLDVNKEDVLKFAQELLKRKEVNRVKFKYKS